MGREGGNFSTHHPWLTRGYNEGKCPPHSHIPYWPLTTRSPQMPSPFVLAGYAGNCIVGRFVVGPGVGSRLGLALAAVALEVS